MRLPPTELGDVEQTVAAREDVDERTELGDVDDLAGVRRRRARRSAGRGSARCGGAASSTAVAVLRADRHRADDAVVAHRDVGAGLLL